MILVEVHHMSLVVERYLSELLQLSPADRGEVAARLLDSLDGIDDPQDDAAWEEEIRRRVEDAVSGRVKGIPLDEAMKQIFADEQADC